MEMMIMVLVFCMVALGIFVFFMSQSEDIRVKNAIMLVNREGQSLSEMFRKDLADVDAWVAADSATMSFVTHGENVVYSWDPFTRVLSRNGVEVARNIVSMDFHYYPAAIATAEAQAGPEIPRPVPNCPPGADPKDCSMTLVNIREVELKFVVGSRSPVYLPGPQKGAVTPGNPFLPETGTGVRIRRQFVLRLGTKNLNQPTTDVSVENACGKLNLVSVGASDIASCDADGESATIKVTTLAPDNTGAMAATDKNPVKIRAVYRYDTDPSPENRCADAACAGQNQGGLWPEAPIIDYPELTSSMRATGGSANIKVTSPADRDGNKILVLAQWTPPSTPTCPNPPLLHRNQLVIRVKAGAAYSMRTSGVAARSSETLGTDAKAAINTCGSFGGCQDTGATLRAQLLDKCGNPVSNMANKVKFTIDISDPGNRFGSFSKIDPSENTLTVSASENGIYTTSIFSGPNMPPGGHIPVHVELVGNPGISGDILVPLRICDIPFKIDLLSPVSGVLPKEGVIPACPGRSEAISFRVLNACGDPITASENPALSPANPENWSISIDSKLSEADEERQVGTLGASAGGKVVPTFSGNTLLINYRTGGTGLDESRLDQTYCGAARSNVPINIKFIPLPESMGRKTILLNLGACPSLSAQLFPDNLLSLPRCADASGSQSACMQPGCSAGGDQGGDFILRTQILSCPMPGKAALSLKNVGVLFVTDSPNLASQYPSFSEGGGQRSYLTAFPGDYAYSSGGKIAHLNPGNLDVMSSIDSKFSARAIFCFPGPNGTLDTTPGSLTCKGDDIEFASNPVSFMVGPSPAGFINKTPSGENFIRGMIGVYKNGTYESSDQLIDMNMSYSFPYGTLVTAPEIGKDSEVFFEVRDCDRNRNPAVQDSLPLKLSGAMTSPNEIVNLTLNETGPNTGVFRGSATLARLTGASQPGKLNTVPGEIINIQYQDPADPGDVITGRLYASGCSGVYFRDASGRAVDAVTPAMTETTPLYFDSSINSKPQKRHTFYMEFKIPEKAFYTGNARFGETANAGVFIASQLYHYPEGSEPRNVFLRESDPSGSPDNNGIFRVNDPNSHYIFLRGLFDCDMDSFCRGIHSTPDRVNVAFGEGGQYEARAASCGASIAVFDVDPPVVTLKKASKGSLSAASLKDGDRVTGMIYLQGEADDGNGNITGINASVDGGLTYLFNGTYDAAAKKWAIAINTNELPDGIYHIAVRAKDSAGNTGYSFNSGSKALTLIVDKYPESIALVGNWGEICGKHTFVADVSRFMAENSSNVKVKFYTDGGATPVAQTTPDRNGLAKATINVDNLTGGPPGHTIRAVASDNSDASVTVGASQTFIVDDSPPMVSLSIPAYDGINPLQGLVEVLVQTHGCSEVKEVKVESYLVNNTTVRSAPVSAKFQRCLESASPDGVCRNAEWVAQLNYPSSCSWSYGFTGDGQNAFHAIATDARGKTATTTSEPAYPVDNPPEIKLKLPENRLVKGSVVFDAEVSDCDGVAKDKVNMTIPGLGTFNMARKSGSDRAGVYSLTLNTSEYPACRFGVSYLPNGVYTFEIMADDNAPAGACLGPETNGALNRCGKLTGTFQVENQPTDVAITSINGAAPVDGRTVGGNFISVAGTAKSCGLKAGFGSVRILVDGRNVGDMIAGPGGQYSINLDAKTAGLTTGQAHTLAISATDGMGGSVESPPRLIGIP